MYLSIFLFLVSGLEPKAPKHTLPLKWNLVCILKTILSKGFSTMKPWFSPWVLVFSDEEQYLFSCTHFLLSSLHKHLETTVGLESNPVLVET